MFCNNCGKEIEENVSFCKYCGSSISSVEVTPINIELPLLRYKKQIKILLPIIAVICVAVALYCAYQAFDYFNAAEYDHQLYIEYSEAESEAYQNYLRLWDSDYYEAKQLANKFYSLADEYGKEADAVLANYNKLQSFGISYLAGAVILFAIPIISFAVINKKRKNNSVNDPEKIEAA